MNVELAMQALKAAKAAPENFRMSAWWTGSEAVVKDSPETMPPCGTTACYAGFVSLLAAPLDSSIKDGWITFPDRSQRHVEGYATEALGITTSQAWSLFYLDNIEQVETALKYLADNPDADEDTLDRVAGVELPWVGL